MEPRILIDEGRGLSDGLPALLKSLRYSRRQEAEALLESLRKEEGRKPALPL